MKMKREVKIGLFALAMLLCLYLGINFLKGKDVFSGDRVYYALYDQTTGLQTGAPVLLRGVKIGSVTNIGIDPDKAEQVVVTVNVKKSIKIPTDSQLKLFTNGIMGGKAIELIPGTASTNFEKHSVIPSEIESGLLEFASLTIEDIIREVKNLMNSLEATSDNISSILEENAESVRGTMNNIRAMTAPNGDLNKAIRDLGEFSAMLKDNSGKFDDIINNLDEVSYDIAQADIKGIVDELGTSLESINGILENISDGEGTAGKLISDDALYDSLVAATGNLSTMLEDLRENPKRYVHFSLFGKKDKDKKKNK